MRNKFYLCCVLTIQATFALPTVAQEIDVIAFGSCAREREEQPVWDSIIAQNPDLFLFIGDNHYADFWEKDGRIAMHPVTKTERLDEAYAALKSQPGFQKIKAHCPLMATWDDHDYGANDAGNDFPLRDASQAAFMDFYGFAADHPIRKQKGIYHSKTFGEAGKRIQVIMLDTRYHRDSLERRATPIAGRGPYQGSKDTSKTILGEAQWQWLEQQLKQPADLRIIASSIQVVADEHFYETWGNMPHERQRLYKLIADTGASGVLFISGDRHLMEISRDVTRGVPYPIWDFTSSGLTQRAQQVKDPNRYRIGPHYRETNFGILRINWNDSADSATVDLEGYGLGNNLLTRQTVFLNELRAK